RPARPALAPPRRPRRQPPLRRCAAPGPAGPGPASAGAPAPLPAGHPEPDPDPPVPASPFPPGTTSSLIRNVAEIHRDPSQARSNLDRPRSDTSAHRISNPTLSLHKPDAEPHQIPRTPCTVGNWCRAGVRNRVAAVASPGVMGVHKLTAGDG